MREETLDRGPAETIVLQRLVGLRWAVFGLLAVTLPLDELLFGYHVRYAVAVPVLLLAMAHNLVLSRRLRSSPATSTSLVAVVVGLDLVAIGAVLAAAGGAGNPFSALFFVHVALAAALLPPRAAFIVAGLAVGVFGALFALPSGACCPSHPEHGAFSTHLYGMLLAFFASSALVAYFLQRVRRALERSAAENAGLRRRAEEASRFGALGTLAAGTAHELATPLGTIAVLADEARNDAGSSVESRRRAETIAEQVERCRAVITKMRRTSRAEPAAGVEIGTCVDRAVQAWRAAHPGVEILVDDEAQPGATVPLEAADVEAALCALLDNALHALRGSRAPHAPIRVTVEHQDGACAVSVEDSGAGIPSHVVGRLGEPFVTTKEPGEGMGLGLYLVRTLVEQVGGRLEVSALEPRGTRVSLRLSAAG